MSCAASTAEAVSAALEPGLRTRAFIYNTLAHDKSVEDRLRHFPSWLSSRNLSNEASDESVMALIEAVRGRYDIPQRWYRLKAQLLGVDRLADYDRAAPVLPEDVTFSYGRVARSGARDLRRFLAASRQGRAEVLRRELDRRAGPPAQARRRVLRLHGAERPSLRDAQLHRTSPRRPDHGPRARPRAPRRPGSAAGRLPSVDAADAGRDGVDLRRGPDLRSDAGRPRATTMPASACSPTGSTARSPRCSARWR